jgi:hypothetical protein
VSAPDLAPRGIGRIIDDGIAYYTRAFGWIWKPLMLVVFPFACFFAVAQVFLIRLVFETFLNPAALSSGQPVLPDAGLFVLYALTLVSSFAYGAARIYFQASLYRSSGPLLEGRRMTTSEFLRAAQKYFWPLVVALLLAGAIQSASYLVAEIVGFATFGIGLLALPLVLVAVMALLSMVAPALCVEDAGITGSLRRSYDLVRPHFWRVVGFLIAAWFIVAQIESAISSPVLIRSLVDSLMHPGAVYQPLSVPWKLFEGLCQGAGLALALPVMELGVLACYLDLRSRREGLDLLVRAQRLAPGAHPAPPVAPMENPAPAV